MYGAFIGDIVGSRYEFDNIKTEDFPLFSRGCDYTDDTIMTVAIAKSILIAADGDSTHPIPLYDIFMNEMQFFGRKYPDPTGAYGGRFMNWIYSEDPKPYYSYGNGSAMRVSPCALVAVNLEEAQNLARISASVTHDHPEGIKGAVATASAIFLAKCGKSKAEIRQYIQDNFYDLNFSMEELRRNYSFDVSCQGSVPQAIFCFLESENFEDAIRKVVSIGGDCDTTGAICGSIAWTWYIMQRGYTAWKHQSKVGDDMLWIRDEAITYLPDEFIDLADDFHELCCTRTESCFQKGSCENLLTMQDRRLLDELKTNAF